MIRIRLLLVGLIVFAVVSFVSPLQAATLNVDGNDPACDDGTGTPYCTIQAAIDDASNDDIIEIAADTYVENLLINGTDLTLQGASRSTTIIDGDAVVRVIEIIDSAVTLNDLTIQKGSSAASGGGILIDGTSSLIVNDCVVQNNEAVDEGGGIYSAGGDVVVNRSVISGNESTGGSIGGVGSLGNLSLNGTPSDFSDHDCIVTGNKALTASEEAGGVAAGSNLSINYCTITMNEAGGAGGGIVGINPLGDKVIANSLIEGNKAPDAAGIYMNNANAVIIGSLIQNNEAADTGGGIVFFQSISDIIESRIHMNLADGPGGGIAMGPAIINIEQSLIDANESMELGGGIYVAGAGATWLTIDNTTISGNTADSFGGGIYMGEGQLLITDSTIYDNDAVSNEGGGIRNNDAGPATTLLTNTILAGNTDMGVAPDCSGTITSGTYNLLGNDEGCTFAASTGDQVGTMSDPLLPGLDALADNGGPTQTHALQNDSPALEMGLCGTATEDQRGARRPGDATGDCDIGAFEQQTMDLTVTKSDDSGGVGVPVGEDITYTILVSNAGPGNALNVVVVDTLPAEVTYNSASSTVGTCAEASGVVTCEVGTIGSGLGITVTIIATAAENGTATNDVEVTGLDVDSNPDNNSASLETVIGSSGGGCSLNGLNQTESSRTPWFVLGLVGVLLIGMRKKRRDRIMRVSGLLIATGLLLCLATPVLAATLVVDQSDANCDDGTGNPYCTIQAAVDDANDNDIIEISADTYVENISITTDLTLQGAGKDQTILDGDMVSVTVAINNATVSINGVTITKGVNANGGGITAGTTDLTVRNSLITGNAVTSSGGGIAITGLLSLENTQVNDNDADATGGGVIVDGDAIVITSEVNDNDAGGQGGGLVVSGALILQDSKVNGNSAAGEGGGLIVAGSATITKSQINGNTTEAEGGGFICNTFAHISDSQIENNTALTDVGGVFCNGFVTVTNSRIVNNTAGLNANLGVGGIGIQSGLLTLIDSTIADNKVLDGVGGGVYIQNGGVDIDNCLISGNQALSDADNMGIGGGLYYEGGGPLSASINNSTFTGNFAEEHGGGIVNANGLMQINNATIVENSIDTGDGGGLLNNDGPAATFIRNSILALNTDPSSSPDCFGTIDSDGFNILGNDEGCTFNDDVTDQIGNMANPLDPMIEELADNGGPTETHALLAGPALDMGSCTDSSGATILQDQRGGLRPGDASGNCDIGAFEQQTMDLEVAKTDDTGGMAVNVGDSIVYSIVVTNNGPADALAVEVIDTLPTEVTFDSADNPAGSCDEADGVVTCDINAIKSGFSAVISITVTAASKGTATNEVAVTGKDVDSDPDNNSASLDTDIATSGGGCSLTPTPAAESTVVWMALLLTVVLLGWRRLQTHS